MIYFKKLKTNVTVCVRTTYQRKVSNFQVIQTLKQLLISGNMWLHLLTTCHMKFPQTSFQLVNVPLVTLTYSLTYSGLYNMLLYSVGKFSESFVYLRALAVLLVIENSVVTEEDGVYVGFRFRYLG